MAQRTIYLPDDLDRLLRREAKKAHKSVSAFIADLARRWAQRSDWQDRLRSLEGSWEGPFPQIEDLPTDEPPDLG